MVLFAETPRLYLRPLEESDLPRLVELIGDWDVTQWLVQVSYPYSIEGAREFYNQQAELYRRGTPEYFTMASKTENAIIGAVGLRPALHEPKPDDGALGYWLGKPYWGQGLMSEAVEAVIAYAFEKEPERRIITATADPANQASQNVLRRAGFDYLGTQPRSNACLRGSPEVTFWRLDNPRFRNKA